MRVHWTDNARRHLRAIHDYIAQNSSRYARRIRYETDTHCRSITE